ncbi:hypothetical protein PMZ80_002586 [Knufia obscura]|uniref:Cohesin loading factor-domain-containing protein n=1 Tax=Knufia obscura TaxID=1635080 RepID=A0ABR0RXS0_9EURO|nr:hypothetical protein PMZ80_002586 [Knufia obscura]
MPYYDQYQADQPFPPNYQQSFQQTQPFSAASPNRVQVIVPPRQQPGYSPSQPQPQANYYPVQQQQQQYYQFGGTSGDQWNQQYFAQQNQQAFAYNQQVQQRYQPPPPPRVIVPPSPSQYAQTSQRPYPQQSIQVKQEHSSPRPMPPKQSTPRPHVLKETKPNISKQITPKTEPNNDSMLPPTQYPSLLLTLADEYIEASKKLEHRSRGYYELVTTALGCMEAALKNFKLSPIREAQLSLKYVQILYDETDNLDEAETILTRSIDLCERMKLIDLKYAMQLLLSKVLFRSKPRAAIKDLHGMIQDIETYRHVAWEYPFRFQAVFFSTEASDHSNLHEALHQLERIQHIAKLNGDHAVYAFAAILESLLHLHTRNADSISNSQQAMAKARSLQLNPDVEQHLQMPVFMDIIDLVWSLDNVSEGDIEPKRKHLKDTLYSKSIDKEWTRDELTWIRVNSSSLKGIPTQEGGLIHEVDGKSYLALSWMNKKELEAIGFLLMGVSIVQQNYALKGKAERFIDEGYLIPKEDFIDRSGMLSAKDERLKHRAHVLGLHFKLESGFMLCSSGQWTKAAQLSKTLRMHLKQTKGHHHTELEALVSYLEGCILQGMGKLEGALKFFQAKPLVLQPKQPHQSPIARSHIQQSGRTHQDLRVLAAINTALIIHSPSHPQHQHLRSLTDTIATHVTSSSPPLISAAYSLLLSAAPDTTMLQMKQLLNAALNSAKQVANNQIISLTLTLMQDKFFRGGVQDVQAVKCAKAAAHQVKSRWGSPLWTAVSGMLEVESLLLQQDPSKQEEVERKKMDVQKAWSAVPQDVKRSMG